MESKRRPELSPRSLVLAASLGLLGGMPFDSSLRVSPSRTSCAECGCKIPPGRAGRRCQPCRDKPRVSLDAVFVEGNL